MILLKRPNQSLETVIKDDLEIFKEGYLSNLYLTQIFLKNKTHIYKEKIIGYPRVNLERGPA